MGTAWRLTSDRQGSTQRVLRASGYREGPCQGVRRWSGTWPQPKEILRPCVFSPAAAPATLRNRLGSSDHVRVLVPSPAPRLCRGLELTPPNPGNVGGTGPTALPLPLPGQAGCLLTMALPSRGRRQPSPRSLFPPVQALKRSLSKPNLLSPAATWGSGLSPPPPFLPR